MPTVTQSASPFLDMVSTLSSSVKGDAAGAGGQYLRRFINSPLADLLVNLTPNPYDNALLAILRATFPNS